MLQVYQTIESSGYVRRGNPVSHANTDLNPVRIGVFGDRVGRGMECFSVPTVYSFLCKPRVLKFPNVQIW